MVRDLPKGRAKELQDIGLSIDATRLKHLYLNLMNISQNIIYLNLNSKCQFKFIHIF